MAKNRNNLVELARFIFSLLVVGYHVQMTWGGAGAHFFAGGALAVEFFFLISGFFMARSIEKTVDLDVQNITSQTKRFIWSKIKGILPAHIVAIILMILVVVLTRRDEAGSLIAQGIPGMFLIQMAAVWDGSYQQALIVPEWYLSSMLLMMLIMFPMGTWLRKRMKGPAVVSLLLVFMLVILLLVKMVVTGGLPENLQQDLRAWGEMCVGMFACYFSAYLSKANLKSGVQKLLPVLEVILYSIPVILGMIPLTSDAKVVTMVASVVCVFGAISITFSCKGLQIRNPELNGFFGVLGSFSLPIYLFHPVLISLFEYLPVQLPLWGWHLVIWLLAIGSAVLYHLISRRRSSAS